MRQRHHTVWAFLVGGLGVFCAFGVAAEAAEMKVGYVQVAKVFDDYQRTKDSNQVLKQKEQGKQAELEGRASELKKLRDGLDLLNDQAKQAKAKELEDKSDVFQQSKAKAQRELLRERNAIAKTIFDEIDQAIQDYAKANHFTVIFDSRSLVYGQDALDVTAEIVKLLNSRYAPQKGAAKP